MKNLNLQDIFFFLLLIALTSAFFNIIEPFYTDIFIAIIFLVISRRPFKFFLKRFNGKRVRATIATMSLLFFLIIIPLGFVGYMITREATDNYVLIKKNWPEIEQHLSPKVLADDLKSFPWLSNKVAQIDFEQWKVTLNNYITKSTQTLLKIVENTFMNISAFIIHTFIILFLLYYLFVDGHKLLARIMSLIPMSRQNENEMFLKLEQVTDALVINTFLIALIEGVYGAILLGILGLPSPFFWGTIMFFLSIIPVVGTNTILVPTAIFQLIIGNYVNGIVILVFGVGAILINQNIIRNRLDGERSGMHPAIIFLSCMGGMAWLGVVGFLAGPILAALFVVAWNQFGKNYNDQIRMSKITEKHDKDLS